MRIHTTKIMRGDVEVTINTADLKPDDKLAPGETVETLTSVPLVGDGDAPAVAGAGEPVADGVQTGGPDGETGSENPENGVSGSEDGQTDSVGGPDGADAGNQVETPLPAGPSEDEIIAALRKEYLDLVGKRAGTKWGADEIRAKMGEFRAASPV
jgi:hypothetical protein